MANGDDGDGSSLDPSIGQFSGFGTLSDPNDPLIDWASNMKPSDLQQFVHDPEGAKQNMIDQGIPPPDHHYVNGFPVSAATASAADAVRSMGPIPDPRQGNITRDPNAAPLAFAGGDNVPDYSGGMGNWQGVGTTPPSAQPLTTGGMNQPAPAAPPAAPTPPLSATPQPGSLGQRFHDWLFGPGGAQAAPAGKGPIGPQLPPKSQDKPDTSGMGEETAGKSGKAPGQPMDITPTQQGIDQAAKDLAEKRQKAQEAMDKFAKTMQGIKMPQAPPPFHAGAPSVRQHSTLTPNAQGLLALLGQPGGQIPSAQAQLLARLLGRIG